MLKIYLRVYDDTSCKKKRKKTDLAQVWVKLMSLVWLIWGWFDHDLTEHNIRFILTLIKPNPTKPIFGPGLTFFRLGLTFFRLGDPGQPKPNQTRIGLGLTPFKFGLTIHMGFGLTLVKSNATKPILGSVWLLLDSILP